MWIILSSGWSPRKKETNERETASGARPQQEVEQIRFALQILRSARGIDHRVRSRTGRAWELWPGRQVRTKFDVGGKIFCRTDVEQKFPAFRVEILRIRGSERRRAGIIGCLSDLRGRRAVIPHAALPTRAKRDNSRPRTRMRLDTYTAWTTWTSAGFCVPVQPQQQYGIMIAVVTSRKKAVMMEKAAIAPAMPHASWISLLWSSAFVAHHVATQVMSQMNHTLKKQEISIKMTLSQEPVWR